MSSVCIQPISLAPGVETIGENEMIDYLEQMSAGDDSILVIDSRTPNWVERGQNSWCDQSSMDKAKHG